MRLDLFRALAETPRDFAIHRPCPILGQAGSHLGATQRQVVRGILEANWEGWSRDQSSIPIWADVYEGGRAFPEERLSSIKVAIVSPKYMQTAPVAVELDIFHHFFHSAKDAGLEVHDFDSQNIVAAAPVEGRDFAHEAGLLTDFLDRVRPDLVIFEATYVPNANTIGPDYWKEQKEKFGFKLVASVGDSYDHLDGNRQLLWYTAPWYDCADQVLVYHTPSAEILDQTNCTIVPGLPFHEATFCRSREKDIVLACAGVGRRDRKAWLDPIFAAGVNVNYSLHNRSGDFCLSTEQYSELLARSVLTFNNGFIDFTQSILTGRFFEGVLSGSVVIQEECDIVNKYFKPFIHYVPVANVNQAIIFAQFLDEDREWATRIAGEAYGFWKERYASELFWRFICSKVLL